MKENKILIPDNTGKIGEKIDVLSYTVKELGEKTNSLDKKSKEIQFVIDVSKYILIGIIIALFICFLGLAWDAYVFHTETYKEYKTTIDSLQNQILEQKLNNLQNQINCLKTNPYNQSICS